MPRKPVPIKSKQGQAGVRKGGGHRKVSPAPGAPKPLVSPTMDIRDLLEPFQAAPLLPRPPRSKRSKLMRAVMMNPDIEAAAQEVRRKQGKGREELIRHVAEHPIHWLLAKDLDGTPFIFTKDERDENDPVKPFPDLEYIHVIADEFMQHDKIAIEKCRQMIVTWTFLLMIDHQCKFKNAQRWLISKSTEEEVEEFFREKVRFVHSHLPTWVQDIVPISSTPMNRIDYPRTASVMTAVNADAKDKKTRGGTISGILVDECARQSELRAILASIAAAVRKIVLVTTPEVKGHPGADTFLNIINEGIS